MWCDRLPDSAHRKNLGDVADLVVRDQIALHNDDDRCESCKALRQEIPQALERLKAAKSNTERLIARLIGEDVAASDKARHEYRQGYRYDTYGAYEDALETQVRNQLPSNRHNDPRFWRIADLLSPLFGVDNKALLIEHLTKWAPTLPAAKLKLELLHASQ